MESLPPETLRPFYSAIRFWERRRLIYNLMLIATALTWLFANWSHFRPALTLSTLVAMTVLGLLANVCYCAAYLAEILIQQFPVEYRSRCRWALWSIGTVLAFVFANYWIADEIYPFVNQGAPNLF
jgi:hypothetical protein